VDAPLRAVVDPDASLGAKDSDGRALLVSALTTGRPASGAGCGTWTLFGW